jgi:hypothetical protein
MSELIERDDKTRTSLQVSQVPPLCLVGPDLTSD